MCTFKNGTSCEVWALFRGEGCKPVSQPAPNINIKSYLVISPENHFQNPVPLSMHYDVVNFGNGDGKNIQVEITVFYDKKVVKKEKVFFGNIKAGESKIKDEILFAPLPVNYDEKLIQANLTKMFIDGEEVYYIGT